MSVSWAITPEKIEAAIKRIISVAQPCKVILFGSVVVGKPDIHSDVDILVVTGNEVESSRKESVRIRRVLRGILMPMDILVIPEKRLQKVAHQSGLVYWKALRHGRVMYGAANDR